MSQSVVVLYKLQNIKRRYNVKMRRGMVNVWCFCKKGFLIAEKSLRIYYDFISTWLR